MYIDLPKSKTAKIIRTLFDQCLKFPGRNRNDPLIDLSKYIIEWCNKESRSFLRMKIENKLADLYFKQGKYNDALAVLNKLLYELKRKDDKQLIVESQLVESKVYHALENLPKSKAALTAVKTTANSIYVVPMLQAEIDMMSGLIAADEKDYATAYSYFYETFEGYRSMNEIPLAGNAFKFMLFSKVMGRAPDDAMNLINSAVSLKFQNRDVEAMKAVAQAAKQQNLLMFEKCKQVYEWELLEDPVIKRHFTYLYNTLLEDNLKKIIEPYSEVQIDYVAQSIGLPMDRILQKLSEMILDEVIKGTLDQGKNCLIIFEDQESTEMFDHALGTFNNLDGVIDSLYEKTQGYKKKYHS
jgi:26S proteasome regulatory subunit N6